jgi:subtilisin-like proprotein convertase family protein
MNPAQISLAEWNTNKFAGRLSNTLKPIGDLVNDSHAILLANAFIDTQLPLNFVFPKNLQPQGDPGAYIVQARGPIDNAFRAMLTQAGATIVAYIPNDAYLVRATAGVAGTLGANPQTQAVVPYEPYYKIQSSLLYPAVEQLRQPDGAMLNLGLFADDATATIQQIEKLGGQVVGRDRSPFGPIVRVVPPRDWTTLATLPGVQILEPFYKRAVANDLARATVGVAADSLTPTNYLNLTGTNIIVEVNDTGIDALHPDLRAGGFYNRASDVIGDAPPSLVDTNGHGTHVAGIIAGDGAKSMTVTNAPGSILNNGQGTNYQFRGIAPGATLYSVGGIAGGGEATSNYISDLYFQEAPALTNALISNNSWTDAGDTAYDLSAASYDAAVRDALPFVTGSQPVLFVFAAGNAGAGNDSEDLGGGVADSIESPATAKNVITVGALQEDRNITTTVTNADGSTGQPWQAMTSTGYRVAGFSSRGNVGIGIEGGFGRYKPDVCAPGTFIISTRSEQWDINTYFYQNPTNDQIQTFSGFIVQPGSTVIRPFPTIPTNAVQLTIATFPNANSPFSFAVLPTLIGLFTSPGFQFITTNDPVFIPPDPNAPTIQQILASGQGFTGAFNFAISNNTSSQVVFDLLTDIETTNGSGTYFLALSNLDQELGTLNSASTGPGPYYRFETGTSMAAPAVSGALALMQEFYAKAYGFPPSPAMLKAMLINGAQATGLYNYVVQNTLNYEGWGLINLPDSLPPGITNQLDAACSTYVQDQNPTNALATGDSQTWFVQTTNALPLRVTLAWTDPPGDPAAAIKLVNNLVLVVTNLSNPTNPIVYYGNDIGSQLSVNNPHGTNTPTAFDKINNVQTVNLSQSTGTNFSVTVMGFRVNVNAVTAQSNNVVQDYALVISCGNGQEPTVMSVSAVPPTVFSNPTGDQQIDFLSGTNVNAALINELVGANTPLLGTNTVPLGILTGLDTNGNSIPLTDFASNAVVTVGMTNQWHFYVVTNSFAATNTDFTNAAFVIFDPNAPDPDTLSIPRMGVFAHTVGNASRVADIDLYVSTSPGLTNLDPNVISSCVHGTQVGFSNPNFNGASLGRGSTEFVVDIASGPGEVYYIGVKSEDQMAAEYGFISIFSATPFSSPQNGNQVVNGVPLPVSIPDGSPKVPGKAFVFGLAIYPITVGTVIVSSSITHQNFGDLIGTLTLNGGHADVLNNHDSFGNLPNTIPPNTYDLKYDDSAGGGTPGSRPSDGPGSLVGYFGQQGIGVWQLTEVDDSSTQIGTVQGYHLTIQPQQDLNGAIEAFSVPAGGWFYGFVDVPPGATNLTVVATNITPVVNPPLEMFIKFGSQPTTNDTSHMALLNLLDPAGKQWGFVSVGPPLTSGRYFVGIFNPSSTPTGGFIYATIGIPFVPAQTIYTSGDTPIPIPDDAVTNDTIVVPDDQTISSMEVALRVDHPRVSDLVFHLIGPDGTRELLVENRGGFDPNGMGATSSNSVLQPQTFSGGAETTTNFINAGSPSGALQVSYNFFTLPDELTVFNADGTTNFDSGMISGSGLFSIPYTNATVAIVMNPFGNPAGPGDAWTFTANTLQTNQFTYLVLTEDTNKTTTPIKFAMPPFGTTNVTIITNVITPGVTNITTNTDLFYLPEEPLIAYDGLNAAGPWTLEIQDDRVGATNPPPQLLSWQLRFIYVTTGTNANGIPPGTTTTNVIPPGSWAYYPVNVPTNADFATNILVFATLPLDMWFNQINNPIGATPPDSLLIPNATGGSMSILTLNGVPPLLPGQTYFIGLFNPNPFPVTNGFQVDFHFIPSSIPLTNGVPITNIITAAVGAGGQSSSLSAASRTISGLGRTIDGQGPASGHGFAYFSITVPPNVDYVTNTLIFATLPLNLWFNQNVAPNGTNPPNFELLTNSTGGDFVLSANSVPPLVPGSTYYLALENTNGVPVTNAFVVNFHFALTNPITGFTITSTNNGVTNGYLLRWTGSTNFQYFIQWKTNLASGYSWNTVSNPVINVSYVSTNGNYSWFDDGSLTGGWPPQKFYRVFANFVAEPPTNGAPVTNVVVAGSIAPFAVTVPTNAIAATNVLVSATGPVNLYFNQTGPPTGNTNAGDVLLLSNVTSGTYVLDGSSAPLLVPGTKYYLGVQNPGTSNVSFVFQVNFAYSAAPTNPITGLTITSTNNGVTNGFLLQWTGLTNYQYIIQWKTNLASGFSWNTVSNPVINLTYIPPNGHYSWFDDGSLTGGWSPQKFYHVVANFISTPTTNGAPVTNVVVAGAITPLTVAVPTNAIAATNVLVSATGPVNVYFNQTGPPTGNTNAGDVLLLSNVTSGTFVLTGSFSPPLVPGANYYLGVQSLGTSNVSFVFQVNFAYGSALGSPPSISSIMTTNVNGTNAILLKWVAPTNYQFQIQWAANLTPVTAWHTISNVVITWSGVVSPTNAAYGIFQFLDDGSLTGGLGPWKFYRLIEYPYATPIPQTLTIINTAIIGNAVQFQWVAPTNYQYQVLWTTNLALPLGSWSILANPVLGVSNGVYTFTDTNQTAPSPGPKFFRVLEH